MRFINIFGIAIAVTGVHAVRGGKGKAQKKASSMASSEATTTTTPTTSSHAAEMSNDSEELERMLEMLFRESFFSQYAGVYGISSGRSSEPRTDAPGWVVGYYNQIAAIAPEPGMVISNEAANQRVREIGEELNRAGGMEKMRQVCEYDRRYLRVIEVAWDGIGEWRG